MAIRSIHSWDLAGGSSKLVHQESIELFGAMHIFARSFVFDDDIEYFLDAVKRKRQGHGAWRASRGGGGRFGCRRDVQRRGAWDGCGDIRQVLIQMYGRSGEA